MGIENRINSTMNKYEWTEEQQPNDRIRYDHMLLTTPLGVFSLERKGWKEYGGVCVGS